jgi:hypothetical protein
MVSRTKLGLAKQPPPSFGALAQKTTQYDDRGSYGTGDRQKAKKSAEIVIASADCSSSFHFIPP